MPIRVLVPIPGEDHTWSLVSVGVSASGEDNTWSLMPVSAPLPTHPTSCFRKGGHKGEDNVTDMTIVMSRYELLTTCIIVECYSLTNISKYIVMIRVIVDYLFMF